MKININNLVYARESLNLSLDEVINKFKKIESWEKGEAEPTYKQVEDLCKYYKREYFFFISEENIIDEPLPVDFRGMNPHENFSKNALCAIRDAQKKISYLNYLLEELDEKLPNFDLNDLLSNTDNEEEDADKIIKALNIVFDDICKLDSKTKIINYYKQKIENQGILVFETSNNIHHKFEDFRGTTGNYLGIKYILINNQEATSGKLFTLIHEFIHIVLNHISYTRDEESYNDEERYIDKIVANILMPKSLVLEEDLSTLDIKKIKKLAEKYGVSVLAFLIRLKNLDKISQKKLKDINKEYLEEVKQSKLKEQPSGGGNPVDTYLKRNGFAYIRYVISSIDNNIIGRGDFGNYVGVNPVKYIDKFAEKVFN